MNPVKISCVIIVKNEEKNIERCLRSIQYVVDETIVIDSFSNDQTPEICKRFGVRFYQVEWEGYSETKNYGISLASHPYILAIDADEALSPELQTEISGLKQNEDQADGYVLKRLTNYCGKWIYHCGWYPDNKLRLWKKDKGQWKGFIHENVDLDPGSRIIHLHYDLFHYSYYSINEHLEQMIRFTDLMSEDLYKRGKRPPMWKLIISPLVKFIVSYFFRAGFLDGFYGLVICILSSYATFLKYAKTRDKIIQARITASKTL